MQQTPAAVTGLAADLQEIFGERLESFVVYGSPADAAPATTMAIVATLTADDLQRCAKKAATWHDAGLATPLFLASHEFERSLDAFPFEFGAIIAEHQVVSGRDPFEGVAVDLKDLRRACEVQARSHLLHLREGYIETRGRSDQVAALLTRSAGSFAALLKNFDRLGGTRPAIPADVLRLASSSKVGTSEAVSLFPAYLAAIQALVRFADEWSDGR